MLSQQMMGDKCRNPDTGSMGAQKQWNAGCLLFHWCWCVSPSLSKGLQATLWYFNIALENHTMAIFIHIVIHTPPWYPHIHLYPHDFPIVGDYPVYITCRFYPPFGDHFTKRNRSSTTFGMSSLGYLIMEYPVHIPILGGSPCFYLWSSFC